MIAGIQSVFDLHVRVPAVVLCSAAIKSSTSCISAASSTPNSMTLRIVRIKHSLPVYRYTKLATCITNTDPSWLCAVPSSAAASQLFCEQS